MKKVYIYKQKNKETEFPIVFKIRIRGKYFTSYAKNEKNSIEATKSRIIYTYCLTKEMNDKEFENYEEIIKDNYVYAIKNTIIGTRKRTDDFPTNFENSKDLIFIEK